MIWIYGGAFWEQESQVHRDSTCSTWGDCRVATIVSVRWAFMSTVDGLYGNYGLGGPEMAMMWVNQNIRSFGGDPSCVTVFGDAGAMSLGLHIFDQHQRQQRQKRMREPQTSLFQSAILQSNPFGYRFRSVAVANFLGTEFKERLDCEDLRCLQSEFRRTHPRPRHSHGSAPQHRRLLRGDQSSQTNTSGANSDYAPDPGQT